MHLHAPHSLLVHWHWYASDSSARVHTMPCSFVVLRCSPRSVHGTYRRLCRLCCRHRCCYGAVSVVAERPMSLATVFECKRSSSFEAQHDRLCSLTDWRRPVL